jgi:hypothetical protein
MPDLPIQPGITFRDIQQNFSNLSSKMGAKHLRLDDGRGMHLHDTGKFSGIGAKAAQRRAEKHDKAFETVLQSIDRHFGKKGIGDMVLGKILTREQVQNKLISVNDLRRIGEEVTLLEREQRVMALIERDLGKRVGDGPVNRALVARLTEDTSVDLDQLEKLLEKPGTFAMMALDKKALLDDVKNPDIGVLQLLAKHGLITDNLQTKKDGWRVDLTTGTDRESFSYDQLVKTTGDTKLTQLRGHDLVAHNGSKFIECYRPRVYDVDDQGETIRRGEKIHLSVDPQQLGEAWDTVLPILLANPDVFDGFKVVKMEKAMGEVRRIEEELKNPNLSDKERTDLTEILDSAKRVAEGAQITLYCYDQPDGSPVDPKRCREVIDEITEALRNKGVGFGEQPDSDHEVNEYCSFRIDKKLVDGDLHRLEPDDVNYREYFDLMPKNPVFKALVK